LRPASACGLGGRPSSTIIVRRRSHVTPRRDSTPLTTGRGGGRGGGGPSLPSAPGGGGRGFAGANFDLFYVFPKSAGISEKDNEMEFISKLGKITIRRKFKLKDMVFNGKVEM